MIAEADAWNSVSRRYIHGAYGIDERAILVEGCVGMDYDWFYYILRELDTVAGLMKGNGTLAEAYEYDAYGKVTMWGYRNGDFNRDGDVDLADDSEFDNAYPSNPPDDPMADIYADGQVYTQDVTAFFAAYTGADEPPIRLYTSAVGNPYFFTGRRLHFMESDFGATLAENHQIQYSRFRHYHPVHGRWLQWEPLQYLDSMNLYEYVHSSPFRGIDPFGLFDWKDKVSDFITGAIDDVLIVPPYIRTWINEGYVGEEGDPQNTGTGTYKAGGWAGAIGSSVNPASLAKNVGKGAVKAIGKELLEEGGEELVEAAAKGGVKLTGQTHHAISKKVHDALERHPHLKGKYNYKDPRFETQAKDAASHNGWQSWHRDLDEKVAEWLDKHPDATQKEFEEWLKKQYNKPDLKERFPNGCP